MKFLSKVLTIVMLFFALSCEDKITELNVDPNTSPVANDAQVLTSAIGYLGYVVDVDLNFDSFLWAQYYTWGLGVSLGNAERFVAEPSNYDGYWQRAYANVLQDLNYLQKSESPAYRGASKVLIAYVYQGLVDHFGDVPYSAANKGEEDAVLTPEFDDDAQIYASLPDLLDEAIEELDGAASDMGADDLIYGGNLNKWIRFANSLKLRILMRTSEVDPNEAEVTSLIENGMFIEDADDMPVIPFSDEIGNQNPMFARAEWGVGDFYFASNATLNVLESLNDPRAEYFYDEATTGDFEGELRGIDQGTVEDEPFTAPSSDYSGSSDYAYAADNDVILMSAWEVWFLRVEADARYSTADDQEVAFANAIESNFDYIGVTEDASDYIASLGYNAGDPLQERIDIIAVQKWISLNGTQEDEGWIESRRFDRPESRLFTDGIFQTPPFSVLPAGTFPASWLYPASERSLNPNAPSQRTLPDKIFWDN